MNDFLVYRITNMINGKIYFGITKCSLSKRWNEHKHNSIHNKKTTYLNRAIKKYNPENFTIQLIKSCDSELEMYDLEISLIDKFKSNDRTIGYNNSTGGEKSSKGRMVSEESRRKISAYQSGRIRQPFSELAKDKMSTVAKGRDTTIATNSSANKRRGKPSHNIKKVILNNEIVFSSITDASLKTGLSIGSIANNLTGRSIKTKAGIWNYV